MAIVKYTNPKSGAVYAYESTGRWNPETQRNEPVRTYLGRVDSETGEIISTGGKRGRKRHPQPDGMDNTSAVSAPTAEQYENILNSLTRTQTMLNEQQAKISQLEKENSRLKSILGNIARQASNY